jgi:precorrin-2/cobalt-factor-2 C20-methyltransferase
MSKDKPGIGRFYGVGVGPGDPELATLKASRIISDVPVIFVPKKAEQSESMAESIISNLSPGIESKIVRMVFPMLRDREQLQEYWHQAADTIWRYLQNGEDGAFVNVGDPLLYGTFIHVLETLKGSHPEIEAEVIPGISSINAAAAKAIVPLASDDDNIAIISGNPGENFIREALENFDTVVFLKVNTLLDKLINILNELNLKGKSVYVRRCTTQDEEIIHDVGSLKGEKPDYFSLLIVRK